MYNRSVFRGLAPRFKEVEPRIQVVLGPRQVGKTTGIRMIADQLKKEMGTPVVWGQGDEPLARTGEWIKQLWNQAVLIPGSLLVIDEVQKVSQWSETIKLLWDMTPIEIRPKVILLGSSTLLIQQGLTESLTGRFDVTRANHWSFSEMHEAFGYSVQDWILLGGYPGAAQYREDPDRWISYIRESLIETTITKDVLSLKRIDKPILLRRLFYLACNYSSQILSYQKMLGQLQDVGNVTTLAGYLELLRTAGLVSGIEKFSNQIARTRASSPKLQVWNQALMTASLEEDFSQIKQNYDLWGRWVESAVGAHLINSIVGKSIDLCYWREGNHEVDFILQKGTKLVALEVKSGRKPRALPGIKHFAKAHPQAKTYLVSNTGEGMPIEEFLRLDPCELL